MTCKGCHTSINTGSTAQMAAKPKAGWVFDPTPEKDWKRNVLRLHDEKHLGTPASTPARSQAKQYDPRGLAATAELGRPILCAACHASNALPGTGVAGVSTLTAALHTKHATVVDPVKNLPLDAVGQSLGLLPVPPGLGHQVPARCDVERRRCQRQRGSQLPELSRQDDRCRQDRSRRLAAAAQLPVLPPRRQAGNQRTRCGRHSACRGRSALCHQSEQAGHGFSLFRFSKGHGGLQCEACHGATHAEYPSVEANDNVQSIALQGYAGTVTECKTCHTSVPNTTTGGPHGMHTIGDAWVSQHGDVAEGQRQTELRLLPWSGFPRQPAERDQGGEDLPRRRQHQVVCRWPRR